MSEMKRRPGTDVSSTTAMRAPIRIMLLVLAMLGRAYAGQVETLVDQLNNDGSDKVRLAAAVNLAKLGDAKAILPLAKALNNDSDQNVRAACAVALGKLVTASTKSSIKSLVVASLKKSVAEDSSSLVQQQAKKALETITGQGGGTTPTNNGGT